MKVIIGSVVKGFTLKTAIKKYLEKQGHEVIDVGCYGTDKFVKFPSIAQRVAYALNKKEAQIAINCCGSGTGAGIATNKFKGVCAISCESVQTARMARFVNDANVLCLGESIVSPKLACQMVDAFINTKFQEVKDIPRNVLDFWKEARDEIMQRGDMPSEREIETM
jgi:ribose 5-phosphate isomerase B